MILFGELLCDSYFDKYRIMVIIDEQLLVPQVLNLPLLLTGSISCFTGFHTSYISSFPIFPIRAVMFIFFSQISLLSTTS